MCVCAACEPELMPSFPRYRNMKRKSSAAPVTEEKTKPKADFGGTFGEPVNSVLVCCHLTLHCCVCELKSVAVSAVFNDVICSAAEMLLRLHCFKGVGCMTPLEFSAPTVC